MSPDPDNLATFLHALCDAAALETLPHFRMPVTITNKMVETGGFDPVTLADQNGERAIRYLIEKRFPDHGIVGEEHGTKLPHAEKRWIIDPIDGTRAFVSGLPVWGTLIGFSDNGRLTCGVMDQPFTRERYWTVGRGSYERIDGQAHRKIETSAITELDNATLMTTSPHLFSEDTDAGYFRLEEAVKMFRYGCDCYAYAMVAAGHVDLVVESGLNIYDIAALVPIIEQAGGVVSDWNGEAVRDRGMANSKMQIIAAANADLHEKAIAVLQA
ncbi:MAG: histidinol-phosphatase [Pseudomonadota bacterium]